MWLFFITLHLVGLVGYNLLLRKSMVAKADPWVMATVMQTAVALPALVLLVISPPKISVFTPSLLAILALAVVLTIMLHLCNVKALQTLEAGVYSILYNLRIIFVTILGVAFLGEQIIPLQILGGFFIFLAVVAVKQKGNKSANLRGIQWGVAAGVSVSLLSALEKHLLTQIGYSDYVISAYITSALIMWVVLVIRGGVKDLRRLPKSQTAQLMTFRTVSAHGFELAMVTGGLASVANYISSLGVIIIVLLGAWLLHERDYPGRKIAATLLALLGLTTILISNLLK
jgi:drug/metabolite transporter (DMT)-like permease